MNLSINTNYNNISYVNKRNAVTYNNFYPYKKQNSQNVNFCGLKTNSLCLRLTAFINKMRTPKDMTWEIPQSIIEEILRERPHLDKEMQRIYAERLVRVRNGLSPYYEGPVDDFDRAVHKKFVQSTAGREDAKENFKKIVKCTDKKMPIQRRVLNEEECEAIYNWYNGGTAEMSNAEKRILNNLIETAPLLEEDCIVYRGIIPRFGNLPNNEFLENIRTGRDITRSLWTSTAPEYAFSVHRFHPDNSFFLNGGKGYIMRIKLPQGTKGLDLRGTNFNSGEISEYILPTNSVIKVNKVDHINQILECEYILPEHQDFIPNHEKFDMKLPKRWDYKLTDTDWSFENSIHTKIETIKYPERIIHTETDLWRMAHKGTKKTDIRTNPDGTKTEVKTFVDEDYKKTIEKIIRDKNGKIIFYKKIEDRV